MATLGAGQVFPVRAKTEKKLKSPAMVITFFAYFISFLIFFQNRKDDTTKDNVLEIDTVPTPIGLPDI